MQSVLAFRVVNTLSRIDSASTFDVDRCTARHILHNISSRLRFDIALVKLSEICFGRFKFLLAFLVWVQPQLDPRLQFLEASEILFYFSPQIDTVVLFSNRVAMNA